MRIKFSHPFSDQPFVRQTPGSSGAWGDCQFLINQDVEECDFWVVYEGLKRPEKTRCPAGNTLLVTAEPPVIKTYQPGYLTQFGAVLTCHRELPHQRVILGQQGLPWHAGLRMANHPVTGHMVTGQALAYDDFLSLGIPPKSLGLSSIASNKRNVAGQAQRLDFLRALKERLGDGLDAFGRGSREIPDKWDALAPYKYHIAIENCAIPDYFTEKIADPFLAGAFVFYHGCTNIEDYFPAGAFRRIELDNVDQAAQVILETMAEGVWETHQAALAKARALVLEEYNIFAVLAQLCREQATNGSASPLRLRPEQRFLPASLPQRLARLAYWTLTRKG